MKTLYLVIQNCGDGSNTIQYTFDETLINKMKEMYNKDELSDSYMDGDGFHYDTLNVPDECTYESLGIHYPLTEQDITRY